METVLKFWVDIEDGAGKRLGAGPLTAISFTFTKRLSSAGTFSAELSGADPNIGALLEKRVAMCRYINQVGALKTVGGGVIDSITRKVTETGELRMVISGNDLTRELMYRSVGALSLASAGAGVTNGPSQIMALAPAGWSLSGGTTAAVVYAGFDGEAVLNALVRVGEHIGEHWRLGDGREIVWLGPAIGFAASGVRAVQQVNNLAGLASGIALITGLEEVSDAADVLSRIMPRGSGNGSAVATLAAATDSAPSGYTLNKASNYLKRDASETNYGRIERAIDFKDLGPLSNTTPDVQNAANMLLQAAYQYLRRYGEPAKSYRVSLAYDGVLEPGTRLHVVYRSLANGQAVYDLDDHLIILETTQQLDGNGRRTIGVVVSTIDRMPESDSRLLAGEMQKSKVFSVHQQLGASVDTLTWRDEMDSSHGAGFRFWLGEEYTSIQRAVFRFQIKALRSTVKSVAGSSTTSNSGGGSSQTSDSGGGGTTTSASGGGQTANGGSHLHNSPILDGTPDYTAGVKVSGGFAQFYAEMGGDKTYQTGTNDSHDHTINSHTHDVSVPSHTHGVSIPSHTHTLTPNITTTYGIFEESGGNTLGLADLVIKLNGGSDLNSQVVDLGGGWYELDLTEEIVDSVFRPAQESNTLAMTTAVAKTARIEAQLTVRGVVQAVAYG